MSAHRLDDWQRHVRHVNAVVLHENKYYRVCKLTKYRNLGFVNRDRFLGIWLLTYDITMSQSLASSLFLVRARAHNRHTMANVEMIAEEIHTMMTGTCNWASFMAVEGRREDAPEPCFWVWPTLKGASHHH